MLSTPHRVNLAGGRGRGHQREPEALPRAGLCLVGGWGGRPRDPRCTYCGVRSGASHCFRGALAQATPAASGRAAGPIAVGQSGHREGLRFSCPISQVLFRRPRALLCSVVEIYSFASY